jgi:hypothetical protein
VTSGGYPGAANDGVSGREGHWASPVRGWPGVGSTCPAMHASG